ncbi:phosphomannomutase [Actinokineospora alba]|uniref:Phosphomannomutase n=1 Tax=Actinokineospora alba TaxID=504798 RepID=A0A1H0WGM5_9PSEU|nr:phospho-sugar mutase [Actinokineospora alba]TDP65312.1 phosphomannomutase [Actinokineospora alba]SDH59498.1 phosphomannomutase [Actinokineospora alba]SDP89711.1 phosphomannomutase [Actinokineospora alba]
MTRLTSDLRDRAFRWIADDPDPDTKLELQKVVAAAMGGDPAAVDEVADRMAGTLEFGTAGLRGPVRAGSNGMNRAVVIRTTAGLAQWLKAQGRGSGIVIVGRDARRGSEAFYADAAGVLAAAGFDVRVLPRPLPTPVLAFAVRKFGAVAGIQITASHNPPADNGYKLYLDSGAQIVPPADREIEAAVTVSPPAVSVPRSDSWTTLGEDVLQAYLDRVSSLPHGTARELRVVATALHGVGAGTLALALNQAGFVDVRMVSEQAQPDPDFPTVPFPNPEEPGATDLLLAKAAEVEADVAIALDPDADRCAVGVRGADGAWRMLLGDETGALLGVHILSTLDRVMHPDALVANTIVSSSLLKSIASAANVRYDATLTGFKWLMRAGDGNGTGLVYAYEEALGHCVDPDSVRDKDGISAAVLVCDLAATLRAAGRTLLDALDDLAVTHGLHLTRQVSLRVTDLARIGKLMSDLRVDPPAELAGVPVTSEDLLPAADVLRFSGEGVRVIVRPSGTEPKIKAYLEIVEPVANRSTLADVRARATGSLDALADEVAGLLR